MLAAMGAFNEELIRSGVLLAGDGLQASAKGARLEWTDGKLAVTDGPFAETKELIAGYWLVDVASKQAAIDLFSRCPPSEDGLQGKLEIRQVFEVSDFPEDILPPQHAAREQAWRDQLQRKGVKP